LPPPTSSSHLRCRSVVPITAGCIGNRGEL
jgi:hypothetical protein